MAGNEQGYDPELEYDPEEEGEPVFSFDEEPSVLSENLMEFISNAELGPVYGHNGVILFDRVQHMLPFLDKEIEGESNIMYRISNRKIVKTIFKIYFRLRRSDLNQPLGPDYHLDEMMNHYFPSIEVPQRDHINQRQRQFADLQRNWRYIDRVIRLNVSDSDGDISVHTFLEENATPEQLTQVYDYVGIWEDRFETDSHLQVALEVVGLSPIDSVDNLTKLYLINPILYFLAMNKQVIETLDWSLKVLENRRPTDRLRSLGTVKSARHR